jgi:hypothetical protein
MVAWPKITRPIELGRLGVLDLTILWTCIEATNEAIEVKE